MRMVAGSNWLFSPLVVCPMQSIELGWKTSALVLIDLQNGVVALQTAPESGMKPGDLLVTQPLRHPFRPRPIGIRSRRFFRGWGASDEQANWVLRLDRQGRP